LSPCGLKTQSVAHSPRSLELLLPSSPLLAHLNGDTEALCIHIRWHGGSLHLHLHLHMHFFFWFRGFLQFLSLPLFFLPGFLSSFMSDLEVK